MGLLTALILRLKLFQRLGQIRQLAIFKLCQCLKVVISLSLINFIFNRFDFLFKLFFTIDTGFFHFPFAFQRVEALLQLRNLLLQHFEAMLGFLVRFF